MIQQRIGIAILVLAFFARFYGVGNACYWLDEFDSLECSTGRGLAHVALAANRWESRLPDLTSLRGAPGWEKIWTSLSSDNHPPLYFILLRWWREGFGDGEVETRMMSVIFSIMAVGLFYLIVREQMPGERALWATGMMAVASSQVYFAHQVRGYALWEMLAMLGLWALCRMQNAECRMTPTLTLPRSTGGGNSAEAIWNGVMFVSVLGMLLTHYFAGATVVSLFVLAILFLRGRRRKYCVGAIACACAVYAIVWGRFLWRQRLAVGINNQWQSDNSGHHYLMTVERFCLLPVRWLSETTANTLSASEGIIVACVMVAIFMAVIWMVGRKRAFLFWVIFLIPLACGVAGLDLARGERCLTIARYTFVVGPGVFAIFGLCAAGRAKMFGRILCAGAIVLSVATIRSVYADDQEWRIMAGVLQREVRPGDRIIYSSGGREAWWAGAMYLGVNFYAPDLPGEAMFLTDGHAPALAEALSAGHTTWVLSANVHERPGTFLPDARVMDYVVVPNVGRVWKLTQ